MQGIPDIRAHRHAMAACPGAPDPDRVRDGMARLDVGRTRESLNGEAQMWLLRLGLRGLRRRRAWRLAGAGTRTRRLGAGRRTRTAACRAVGRCRARARRWALAWRWARARANAWWGAVARGGARTGRRACVGRKDAVPAGSAGRPGVISRSGQQRARI